MTHFRRELALAYAAKGWLVFPVHNIQANGTCSCGLKCGREGKHPRVRWKEEATTDVATISAWWRAWPEANIAIVTGRASNLWVLDVDVRRSVELGDGTLVPEGEHTLRQLESRFDTLPDTLTARTGSGGEHLYFTYPGTGDHGNRVGFAPGLDIRADGGYVVAPGSNHLSGHDYEWLVPRPPGPPPGWLVEYGRAQPGAEPELSAAVERVGSGGRNDYLTREAGKLRNAHPSYSEETIGNLLWAINLEVCDPALDADEVRKIAHSAMRFDTTPEPEIVLESGEVRAPPEIPAGADLAWSISEFMALEIEPPEPLVHNLMDAGTGIVIAGPGGVGKSWLAMHLGLAVATGTPFLDHWPTEPGSVLIIDEEGYPYGDQQRFRMLINGMSLGSLLQVPLHLAVGKGLKLDTPTGLATLQRLVGRYEPKLIIFDSLIRVSSGDESNAREMANFFAIAEVIKRSAGSAFCFVAHTKKVGNEPPADLAELLRGTGEIKNWLDTLFIVLAGEMSTDMKVYVEKQRWRKRPEHPFTVRLLTREDELWAKLGYQGDVAKEDRSSTGTQSRIMAAIVAILSEGKEPNPDLIGVRINLSTDTTRSHLNQMVASGLLLAQRSKLTRGSSYIPTPPKQNYNGGERYDDRPGQW
jgi:Bifunctional DNA primase/polymerase, N-terminal/AAA domain/Primase C terminal 1 (PriCT-1)